MTEKAKKTIYEFYESLLAAAALSAKEDGSITFAFSKTNDLVKLGDKKLTMPIPSLLRHPEPDQIFFHPLCEQFTRKESEVFLFLKRSMTLKLITSFSTLGSNLIKLQEDPALQRKMSFEQMTVMQEVAISENKSYKTAMTNWMHMLMSDLKTNITRMDKWPVNIYLKQNGQFKGKSYRRVAIVGFPLLEKIFAGHRFTKEGPKGEEDLFRDKDYPMFKQVAKAIFPGILEADIYNNGYDGTFAPYLIAFLRSFKILADRINYLVDMFQDPLAEIGTDTASMRINTQWGDLVCDEGVTELAALARAIPVLKGNAGAVPGQEAEAEVEPVRAEPTKPAEVVKEAPKKEIPDNTQSSAEILEALEKKRIWKKQQDELEAMQRERDERRRETTDRSREYRDERTSTRDDRDEPSYRRRDSRDDRDDRRRDEPRRVERDEPLVRTEGGVSFTDLVKRNPDVVRGTRTEEESRDSRYDDRRDSRRDYRDDRDDRNYRGRDDRDDRSYRGRDDRDDRNYRGRDDRYDRDRRDYRDDRGYRDDRSRDSGRGGWNYRR